MALETAIRQQGADVAICGRSRDSLDQTAGEIRALGVQCWPIQADVSRMEDVERLADFIEKNFLVKKNQNRQG
jgi:gluconate 5-dehydrogenase